MTKIKEPEKHSYISGSLIHVSHKNIFFKSSSVFNVNKIWRVCDDEEKFLAWVFKWIACNFPDFRKKKRLGLRMQMEFRLIEYNTVFKCHKGMSVK